MSDKILTSVSNDINGGSLLQYVPNMSEPCSTVILLDLRPSKFYVGLIARHLNNDVASEASEVNDG